MDLAQPLFPPPTGRMWHLYQNVPVFTGDGTSALCNLPEGDVGATHYTNFHGITTYAAVGNWGAPDGIAPDATMYELGRWIYAQFNVFSDGVLVATMASEPDKDAASPVLNMYASEVFREYASPPGLWPERFQFTVHSHSHRPDAGSIAIELVKWVGDVWVAIPACDAYTCLLGPPPKLGGPCPPPCQPDTTSKLLAHAGLPEAITVGWGRTHTRVDATLQALGALADLTWPEQWDDAKTLMLDGLHYEAQALPRAGFTESCEWVWTNLPLTLADGTPLYATTNVTKTNQADQPTMPT